jgi:hypothetical protein
MYYVWKRHPDGYIAAATYKPQGWTYKNEDEEVNVSFEILLATEIWEVALQYLDDKRSEWKSC